MDPPSAGLPPQRRIIKRYSNRKLYDTRESRYVTLLEISNFVRAGEDVQVIDNSTKEDKTDVTLALIISEELKVEPKAVAPNTLRAIIRERGERLLHQLREGPIKRLVPWEAEGPLAGADNRDLIADDADADSAAAARPPSSESSQTPVSGRGLRATLEQWQQAIDERIRAVIPNFALLSEVQQEVRRLDERLSQLDERLSRLDERLQITPPTGERADNPDDVVRE